MSNQITNFSNQITNQLQEVTKELKGDIHYLKHDMNHLKHEFAISSTRQATMERYAKTVTEQMLQNRGAGKR